MGCSCATAERRLSDSVAPVRPSHVRYRGGVPFDHGVGLGCSSYQPTLLSTIVEMHSISITSVALTKRWFSSRSGSVVSSTTVHSTPHSSGGSLNGTLKPAALN